MKNIPLSAQAVYRFVFAVSQLIVINHDKLQ